MIFRRAVIVGGVVAGFGFLAFALRQAGPSAAWLPGCLFHHFTGLHCAGCGMTRAAHATLHGDFAAAFRFNPVGMVLLPLAGFFCTVQLGFRLAGKPAPAFAPAKLRFGWICAAIVLGFTILRNLPWHPFTLLAPH